MLAKMWIWDEQGPLVGNSNIIAARNKGQVRCPAASVSVCVPKSFLWLFCECLSYVIAALAKPVQTQPIFFLFLRIPFRIVPLLTAEPSRYKRSCVVVLPLRSDCSAWHSGVWVGYLVGASNACCPFQHSESISGYLFERVCRRFSSF